MLAKILDRYQHDPAMLATLAARWRRRAYRDNFVGGWRWAHAYSAVGSAILANWGHENRAHEMRLFNLAKRDDEIRQFTGKA